LWEDFNTITVLLVEDDDLVVSENPDFLATYQSPGPGFLTFPMLLIFGAVT
jgi:hypothetical protein